MGGRVAIGLSGCQEWPNRRLSPRAIFNSTLTKEPRLPGLSRNRGSFQRIMADAAANEGTLGGVAILACRHGT